MAAYQISVYKRFSDGFQVETNYRPSRLVEGLSVRPGAVYKHILACGSSEAFQKKVHDLWLYDGVCVSSDVERVYVACHKPFQEPPFIDE